MSERSPLIRSLPVFVVLAAGPASAQTQDGLEEVVVTAQRRAENVQDLAISITAFTSDSLRELGYSDLKEIAGQTPGLNANGSIGDSNPIFTIRGIGLNDTFSNNNPSTSVYVDEVLLPFSPMLSMQLFDLERVEVLKGPQGTLYGRNTTGGAINLISVKPAQETSAFVRLDYGRYDRGEIEAAIGGPLTDTLSGRLAVIAVNQSDGWQTNAFTGQTIGDKEQYAARAQLAWEPSERTDVLLRLNWGSDESDNQLREHVGSYSAPFSFTPCAATLEGRRDEGNCVDFLGYFDPTPDRRTVEDSSLYGHERDADTWSGGLTISYDFDAFTLTSVTGYSEFDRVLGDDSDGAALIELDSQFSDDIESFTQELRLSSSGDSPLTWVAGVYYSDDTIDGDILQALDQHIFLTRVDTNWTQKTESYAAFGQFDWAITDHWSLIAGLRYTDEDKSIRYDAFDLNPFGTSQFLPTPVAGIHNEISNDNVSGKLGVDFHVNDDVMLYASASRGFKSGGFKAAIAFNPSELDPFEPEELDAYEIGVKSTLADGRLRLNAAAYYNDWRDFQAFITENRSGINVIVLSNAGDAEVKGFETEIAFAPVAGLDVTLGANWMDTEITKFNTVPGAVDATGNELANAPEWMVNATARYEFAVGGGNTRAYVLAAGRYQDSQFFTVTNNPQASQPSYSTIDARIGLRDADGRWEASLYGRNLSDELYITQAYDNYPGIFPSQYFLSEPRTYGLSVQFNYR
jgi:iron complex outermembrane receptor protein